MRFHIVRDDGFGDRTIETHELNQDDAVCVVLEVTGGEIEQIGAMSPTATIYSQCDDDVMEQEDHERLLDAIKSRPGAYRRGE